MSLEEVEDLCVTRFALSTTRGIIMTGLRQVVKRITDSGISCDVWLNGSFLTEKIDPADVDLVALVPAQFYDAGTSDQRATLEWLTSNDPKKLHRCDSHAEPMYP